MDVLTMEAKQDDVIRFPARDGIGSTFIRSSDLDAPSLDTAAFEPDAHKKNAATPTSPLSNSPADGFVKIDRGDGFITRIKIGNE
jgi:hypothetical protein